MTDGEAIEKPVKLRLFPTLPPMMENKPKIFVGKDKEIGSNNFDSGSEDDLDIISNMISVLPLEYDVVTKVTEEEDGSAEEMDTHKPLCYYVMHDDSVNKDKTIFKRPNMSIQ